MPDVEVKLNIEAQHKEALSAIQELGKALQAVQDKAKAVTDSAKSVTANTAGNKQQGSTEDVAALTKANTELARALVLVNKAAEQAKASVAALSALQPQSPEATQLIEQAASGYERLANMAKAAADAAERFNAVGKAGLTTEEMVRQTEAAGKMVESLKKQAEELQKNISAQQEQLAALKAITAEQQKASQTRNKEQKEIERSIALRDKEVKKEEELEFRMKLSVLTRQQLAQAMADLTKQMQAAAAAGDKETWEKLSFQLRIARSEMEKTASRMTMNRILYSQQAAAASRLSGNIDKLTEGFSNMGEAAENGSLDLTGMAGSVVDLVSTMRAGLGPVGWFMLALKAVQDVINEQAKHEKALSDMHKKDTAGVQLLGKAYEELSEAREKAAAQEKREQSLAVLKAQYDELNKSLKAGLDLINAQVSAELRRQQLTQDEAQFQRTLKKHELGRALAEGEMTRDEYDLAILGLDEQQALETAAAKVKTQASRLEASERARKLREQDSATKRKQAEQAEYELSLFGVDESEISKFKSRSQDFKKDEEEAKKALDAMLKEAQDAGITDALTAGIHNTSAAALELLTLGFADTSTWSEQKTKQMEEAYNNFIAAQNRLLEYEGEMYSRMGNREVEDYEADKNTAEQKAKTTKQEAQAAQTAANAAFQEEKNARESLNIAKEEEATTKRRRQELRANKQKDIESNKKVQALRERQEKEYEALEESIHMLTKQQLQEELSAAKKQAGSDNTLMSSFGSRKLSLLRGESSRRRGVRITEKYLGDGVFSNDEYNKVVSKLNEAIRERDVEQYELYRNILKLATEVVKNKKDREKLNKQLNKELPR